MLYYYQLLKRLHQNNLFDIIRRRYNEGDIIQNMQNVIDGFSKISSHFRRVQSTKNYSETRKILIAGIALFLVYSGLRFAEAMLLGGNPVIGYGALGGGFALSIICVLLYLIYPDPKVFPIIIGSLVMVTFIILSIYMQAIDFHYYMMLLVVCLISSLKKFMPLAIFVALNVLATALMNIFVVPHLDWLDDFRFFTQFMLFMYGSAFVMWQTYGVEQNEIKLTDSVEALRRREKMLTAINEIAISLLSHKHEENEDVLSEGLKPITDVEGISRVVVYKYSLVKDSFEQVYLWVGKTMPLESKLLNVPNDPPVLRWREVLFANEIINANVRDLAVDEALWLGRLGIKSVFFVPIFRMGVFWGTVVFDNHDDYKYFGDDCVELLKSTAHLCVDVVTRGATEREIKRLEKESEKVFLDGLTGIYNRRYFDESIKRVLHELSRYKGVLSLMMIDIDCFKKYNDTYGHAMGDDCLRSIADALSKNVARTGDFIARYGGEEFVIVLPNTNEEGARNIAQKLLECVRDCDIPHESSDAADHVTISIGAATGKIEHIGPIEDYLKSADEMLYKSKQEGRNKYFWQSFN